MVTEEAKDEEESVDELREPDPISFAEFLQDVPPSQPRRVTKLWFFDSDRNKILSRPDLNLHCATPELCNRISVFRATSDKVYFNRETRRDTFVTYQCSNCRKTEKLFSIQAEADDDKSGRCYKYGELPPFGPPTPPRLQRLLQPDRLLFMKGRRCESQGLGVGAFVYYRRVVENQKNRILDEVIKVALKLAAPEETIKTLSAAKEENQFSRAMESVRDAIPQALLINGANPLTLLHSALSDGLHGRSDEECLETAHDVRVILVELAERLGQALKDEAELNTAVTRLMKSRDRPPERRA
jgi:hypothetical protein